MRFENLKSGQAGSRAHTGISSQEEKQVYRVLFGMPSLHVTCNAHDSQFPGPQMSAEFSGLEF